MNTEKDSYYLLQFGRRIMEIRKGKKLSYRKLAQQCDIDYSNISKIEKGKINVQLLTIIELAKGLGVHFKELLDFELCPNEEEAIKIDYM